jgi:hypothetical protein
MNSFRLAKIQVTALCLSYSDGYGRAATGCVRKYLAYHKHKAQLWFDIDITSWHRSTEILSLGEKAQAIDLAATFSMQAIAENHSPNKIFIAGSATPRITAADRNGIRTWNFELSEQDAALSKFFEQRSVDGVPAWFFQNPCLFAAFCRQPGWQLLVSNLRSPTIWSSAKVNAEMFGYYAQPMICRDGLEDTNPIVPIMSEIGSLWERQVEYSHKNKWEQKYQEPVVGLWNRLRATQ